MLVVSVFVIHILILNDLNLLSRRFTYLTGFRQVLQSPGSLERSYGNGLSLTFTLVYSPFTTDEKKLGLEANG